MRQRCSNPNAYAYKWYGGKGISCCSEWDNFAVFRTWAEANGYADKLELDRKDSDKDYSPVNCRWVTKKQNIRNRDMFWSIELDQRLVAFAQMKELNPYAVIEAAVTEYLDKEVS